MLENLIRQNSELTDAEIAQLANRLTKKTMKVKEIVVHLREVKSARLGVNGAFTGPLVQFMESLEADPAINPQEAAVRDGIDKFFGFLLEGSEEMNTDKDPVAYETQQVMSILLQAGIFTKEQVDNFYALGGGLIAPGTTEADVAAKRQELAVRDAYYQKIAYIENELLRPAFEDSTKTDAELIAVFNQAIAYLGG